MTTNLLPFTDTSEFLKHFAAQEEASFALSRAQDADPNLEFNDPAKWEPLNDKMHEAYQALVRCINAQVCTQAERDLLTLLHAAKASGRTVMLLAPGQNVGMLTISDSGPDSVENAIQQIRSIYKAQEVA